MDETDVAFSAWFWSLVSSISPGGTPTASDSVTLLLTIQLFSLLPHYQRTDTRERERESESESESERERER